MNTQIKAEELRIGNYLERNGLMQVTAINKTKVRIYDHFNKIGNQYFFPVESFNGLPITEELLLKAGFVRQKTFDGITIDSWRHESRHHIVMRNGSYVYRVPGVSLAEIQYIHQLQNLYFALTGKELTI